jgi:drug/metabolite transporter (DMT)-like permease
MTPRPSSVKADLLLLLASLIWGLAFVAQRLGMEHIGPFLFNGIRFTIGAGTLLLAGLFIKRLSVLGKNDERRKEVVSRQSSVFSPARDIAGEGGSQSAVGGRQSAVNEKSRQLTIDSKKGETNGKLFSGSGILLGLVLFTGASLQQVGIVYTTAGNAGFITGFYVIFVPLLGLVFRQRPGWGVWAGAFLALAGMYFLSVTNSKVSFGDVLVFISAFFWGIHVLYIGYLSPRHRAVQLAVTQYIVCAVLSMITALIFEHISMENISLAAIPILYGGILAVGVAFTLQIVAQQNAPPAHAAIILSLETVFAFLGGIMILHEDHTPKKWIGCALILAGMMIAQLYRGSNRSKM